MISYEMLRNARVCSREKIIEANEAKRTKPFELLEYKKPFEHDKVLFFMEFYEYCKRFPLIEATSIGWSTWLASKEGSSLGV